MQADPVKSALKARKGQTLHTISPDATVLEALERMAQRSIGALVVIEDDDVIGIFTERCYARKLILTGRFSKDTPVRVVMRDFIEVDQEESLAECLALMSREKSRYLLVRSPAEILGLVSMGDVVREMLARQHFQIEQLEHYITGDYA